MHILISGLFCKISPKCHLPKKLRISDEHVKKVWKKNQFYQKSVFWTYRIFLRKVLFHIPSGCFTFPSFKALCVKIMQFCDIICFLCLFYRNEPFYKGLASPVCDTFYVRILCLISIIDLIKPVLVFYSGIYWTYLISSPISKQGILYLIWLFNNKNIPFLVYLSHFNARPSASFCIWKVGV